MLKCQVFVEIEWNPLRTTFRTFSILFPLNKQTQVDVSETSMIYDIVEVSIYKSNYDANEFSEKELFAQETSRPDLGEMFEWKN